LTPAKIVGEPIEKLLDLLKEPENRVRYRARIELGGRNSDEVVAALQKWIAALDPKDPEYEHNMMEGLWAYQYQKRRESRPAPSDAGFIRSPGSTGRRFECFALGAIGCPMRCRC